MEGESSLGLGGEPLTAGGGIPRSRHCEERGDEAIQRGPAAPIDPAAPDRRAAPAMTFQSVRNML